jgi:hypothetical protein
MSKYIIKTRKDFIDLHGHEDYCCDYCRKPLSKNPSYMSHTDSIIRLIYCFCNDSCMNLWLLERISNV